MGEVYKARDTRLDRTVAIKVLPQSLAADPQFRARFDREARTLSQLTHPHICTLYDVGGDEATAFLVMELLSGETLAARLARGPLLLRDALTTAIEIAEALEAAHRAGIVHRDVKPGNIMLTRDGTQLLDFGLAKVRTAGQSPVLDSAATVPGTTPLTGHGTILGTLHYMAPEQLEGKEADARTDVFAFGAVLYEMLMARKAFDGSSPASVVGAILKDDPPPLSLLPTAPVALDRVIRVCLAKDPDERWQSMGDLRRELQWIAETGATTGVPSGTPLRSRNRERLAWGVIGLLAGSLAAGVGVWRLTRVAPAPARLAHLTIPLPADAPVHLRNQPALALSPDGTQLAYVADRSGGTQLYLRTMDQTEARPVPGTEGGGTPFFSPDGQWLGFAVNGTLKKVALNGGTPIKICDIREDSGAAWAQDGTITFSDGTSLMQVSAAGGRPEALTTLNAANKETAHLWPDVLPDGRGVLFTAWTGGRFDDAAIAVYSGTTSGPRDLGLKGTFARYASTGHLVYAREGSLMAAPFDLTRLAVTGPPIPILEGILMHAPSGAAQFSFSQNGTLVYAALGAVPSRAMVWVDRRGKVEPVGGDEQDFVYPRLSRDDQHVVIGRGSGTSNLWIYQMARSTFTRLTSASADVRPIWTPDDRHITFTSSRAGPLNLFWMPADGSGAPERLHASQFVQFPSSWSPDGKYLGVMEIHPVTGWDLWVLPRNDRTKPQPFLQTSFNEGWLEFSPDGGWVAYTADDSGRWEVYVRPFPGPGGKVQISSEGGTEAVWNRAGGELFYRNRDKMMAVTVTTTPTFTAEKPRLLFEGRYEMGPVQGMVNYDVARDGRRFLMLAPQGASTPARLDVMTNWFSELQRRAGSGPKS